MIKRNMSLIVTNQFLTVLADSIFMLAIQWYMYDLTQSPLSASLITAVTALTGIFLSPFVGVFVDRKEPKSSMQIGYGIVVALGILLSTVYLFWLNGIAFAIYITIVIHTISMALIWPAKNKLLPRIVGVDRIVKVNGYISSTSATASLIGQGISGVLIAALGFIGVMLMHSGVFICASILLIFVINIIAPQTELPAKIKTTKKPSVINELKEGWNVLKSNRPLLKLTILASLMNATTIAGALMVVLIADHYKGDALSFGLFGSFAAAGGILIGLVAEKLTSFAKPAVVMFTALATGGAAFMGMGITTVIAGGILLFVIMNMVLTVYGILYNSLLIVLVEDEYRGRVFTLNSAIASVLMPFFAIIGGFVAERGIAVNQLFIGAGLWVILLSFYILIDKDIRALSKVSEKDIA